MGRHEGRDPPRPAGDVTTVFVDTEIVSCAAGTERLLGAPCRSILRAVGDGRLDLVAPVLPITHALVRRVPDLMERHPGPSARDAIHVATCPHEGITEIISPDRAFNGIPGLQRLDPLAMSLPRS